MMCHGDFLEMTNRCVLFESLPRCYHDIKDPA